MKKLFLGLCLLASVGSFAAERKEVEIKSIDDSSTITIKNDCTLTVERDFWFDKKKKIDCVGLILKKVVGETSTGKEVELENVLIYPITNLQDAENIVLAIKIKMSGETHEGLTLDLSNLRFHNKAIKLSDLTSDERDDVDILLGGISLKSEYIQSASGRSIKTNKSLNAGIN